jgi:hypothetical protein
VAAIELDPLSLGNFLEEGCYTDILSLVVLAIGDQSGNINTVKRSNDTPVLQRSDDVEFGRTEPVDKDVRF